MILTKLRTWDRITDMENESKSSKQGIIEKIIPILLVLSIGLAFVVGILWQKVSNIEKGNTVSLQPAEETQPTVNIDTIKELFSKDLIKFGDANSKVIFVEIADPSCPYCHVAGGYNPKLSASIDTQTNRFKYVSDGGDYAPPVPEMEKLVKEGKASYVYIYYPGHGNGEMAMKAVYCANEKGKFWEADNLIMSEAGYELMNTTVQNDKTKSQVVANFLKSVVDPTFIKSCLDSGKYDARLASDQEIATSLGIQGTPGFYVNATNFGGAYSYTEMKSTVDAALK